MIQSPQTAQSQPQTFNLGGEWIGHYRGHYDQVIKITQLGEEIVAVKITGDEHVPGGAVTFRANVRTGVGEGQVAEKEFRNPCFVPGKLEVVNAERIVFTWENCGKVEFRKDD
jgi:Cyclin D1 binding domain